MLELVQVGLLLLCNRRCEMTGAVDGCIICGKYCITFTVVNTYTHGTHTVATIAPGCKVIASCCKIIALFCEIISTCSHIVFLCRNPVAIIGPWCKIVTLTLQNLCSMLQNSALCCNTLLYVAKPLLHIADHCIMSAQPAIVNCSV